MIKKLIIGGLIVGSLMALTVSQAFAAQGQITEVNPSGIHGMNKGNAASGGTAGAALGQKAGYVAFSTSANLP